MVPHTASLLAAVVGLNLLAPVAALIPENAPVKDSQVLAMIESQQQLPWTQLNDNTYHVMLDNDEWLSWESLYRSTNNMTDDLGRVIPDDIAHLDWANDLGSEELQKRQRPIVCYGSGSYARAIVLNGLLTGVCEGFNYGVGAGVRQVIKSFDLEDIGGRRMEAVWTFVKRVARIGSTISCSGALGNVISNYCEPNEEGSELVTRGGEAFGQDGDEYHVDPYEYGCGC